jgi:hypothetical protein
VKLQLQFNTEEIIVQTTRSERIAKSNAARQRRRDLKDIIIGKTSRLFSRARKLRRKKSKLALN